MAQPVLAFLRQSLRLKASCAACVKDAKPGPVHHVRSASRRMEATLELLTLKGGVGGLRAASEPLRRSLRKIRRAAGEVRDLDVLCDLLAAYEKSAAVERLDRALRRAREKAARRLQERLGKEESRMRRALDGLEVALEPALDVTLSGEALVAIARSSFAKAVRGLDAGEDEQLHSVRKACKMARYVAELGLEDSSEAARMAARFEAVQRTLGEWHDHLLLLQEARAKADAGDELVVRLAADSIRMRRTARVAAERLIKTLSA